MIAHIHPSISRECLDERRCRSSDMAGLRANGYVRSVTGQGAAGRLPATSTKRPCWIFIGQSRRHIFAIGLDNDNPSCAVERVVNSAVADALDRAERLLIGRLGEVTLAELAEQFDAICHAELKQVGPIGGCPFVV